jgi:hypothetical protein
MAIPLEKFCEPDIIGVSKTDQFNFKKKGIKPIMKNPAIFYGGIVLAIVGIALGVFFLIPNIPHVIADSNMHWKHAALFFGLAVVGIIGALVARPKAAEYR